jgi:NADPH:quinone reductase-like Zn-dependent oxidoreductase
VRAAGVRRFGDPVELLELPEPRALRPDEVLIDVRACGIGNWDEIVRSGGWDLGARPPMALGAEAAVNAVPGGSIQAMKAVRDGGRLATITSDPPATEREISVREVYVAPDGSRLSCLVRLLAQGALTVAVGERFPLEQGAAALARVWHVAPGSAVVLQP